MNYSVKIDAEDSYILKEKWYLDNDGYAVTRKSKKMHRIIMNEPKGYVVDHINHDKLDNRKCNLRIATIQENARNRKKPTGVFKRKDTGRWQAQIMHNRKQIRLGCYDTYDEALGVRREAEQRLWSHG